MKRATFIAVALWVLVATLAPWLCPADPLALGGDPLSPPSAANLLGTDALGRDVLSRVITGARLSLRVALLAVGLALLAGGTLGLLAGLRGGLADVVISRSTEVLFAVPDVLLALVLLAVLGPGLDHVALAVGIVYTPILARVARAAALELAHQPHVEAARALGASEARVLVRHVLPNAAPQLAVVTTLCLAFAILAEAALGFLGLSGEPDLPSWGNLLRDGKGWIEQAWWIAAAPGAAISAAVLSLNLLGDVLTEGPRGTRPRGG